MHINEITASDECGYGERNARTRPRAKESSESALYTSVLPTSTSTYQRQTASTRPLAPCFYCTYKHGAHLCLRLGRREAVSAVAAAGRASGDATAETTATAPLQLVQEGVSCTRRMAGGRAGGRADGRACE